VSTGTVHAQAVRTDRKSQALANSGTIDEGERLGEMRAPSAHEKRDPVLGRSHDGSVEAQSMVKPLIGKGDCSCRENGKRVLAEHKQRPRPCREKAPRRAARR
jgi:hypothetical protein